MCNDASETCVWWMRSMYWMCCCACRVLTTSGPEWRFQISAALKSTSSADWMMSCTEVEESQGSSQIHDAVMIFFHLDDKDLVTPQFFIVGK